MDKSSSPWGVDGSQTPLQSKPISASIPVFPSEQTPQLSVIAVPKQTPLQSWSLFAIWSVNPPEHTPQSSK